MNKKQRTYSWEVDTVTPNLLAKTRENKIIALVIVCNDRYGTYFLIKFVQPNIDEDVYKKIMKKNKTKTETHTLKLANEILQSVGFVLEERPKIPKKNEEPCHTHKDADKNSFEELVESIYVWKKLTPTIYSAIQNNKDNLIFISRNGLYWRVSLEVEKINSRNMLGYGELIRLITTLFPNSSVSSVFPKYEIYADFLNTEWSMGPFEDPQKDLLEIQNVLDKILNKFGFILYPSV